MPNLSKLLPVKRGRNHLIEGRNLLWVTEVFLCRPPNNIKLRFGVVNEGVLVPIVVKSNPLAARDMSKLRRTTYSLDTLTEVR